MQALVLTAEKLCVALWITFLLYLNLHFYFVEKFSFLNQCIILYFHYLIFFFLRHLFLFLCLCSFFTSHSWFFFLYSGLWILLSFGPCSSRKDYRSQAGYHGLHTALPLFCCFDFVVPANILTSSVIRYTLCFTAVNEPRLHCACRLTVLPLRAFEFVTLI